MSAPQTTRAAVYRGPGKISVEDRDLRPVGAHEVVVEVSHCGVCGSDLHLMWEGWGPTDVVQGHEYSGTVAALGDQVSRFDVGDQVVSGPLPDVEIRPGHGEPGGFARFLVAHESGLTRVPDGLQLREAALAEPLAVALHALTRADIPKLLRTRWIPVAPLGRRHHGVGVGVGLDVHPPRSNFGVWVFGAGPIGALVVAALKAQGIEPVGVVEPGSSRRALARALGADPVVTPEDIPETTMLEPARIMDGAADVVFECSGKRAAMEAGLGMVRRGGRLVLVGAGMEPPHFDPNRILINEVTITGAYCYDEDGGIEAALDLLASGVLPTDLLIEPDDVPLEGLIDVLQGLADGKVAAKALVAPR